MDSPETPPTPDHSGQGSYGLPKFEGSPEANLDFQVPSISFVDAYLRMWRLYTNFRIRSTRGEYWKAYLVGAVIGLLLLAVFIVAHNPLFFILYYVYGIALLIPSIGLTLRRLHDTDHSGGWIFVGFVPLVGTIILLVFLTQRSTPGPNRYGPPVTSLP